MNLFKKTTSLYRNSLLLAISGLLFQPTVNIQTLRGYSDQAIPSREVSLVITPHFEEYARYKNALENWTDYDQKDSFNTKKLKELQE